MPQLRSIVSDTQYLRITELTHTLLRVIAGLFVMQRGAQKLFGLFGGMGAPGATAPIFSLMGLAGIIELFGGLFVAAGLFGRFAAFILSGELAVAYFKAHLPRSPWPIENGGELAALFSFAFLLLAAWGSGRYSLDALLGRRHLRLERATLEAQRRRAA
jgi:putative oxidoreductase